MATHTAIVRPDGTILVPVDEARPGETVIVRIEQPVLSANDRRADDRNLDWLTLKTATTPELKEAFIQKWLAIGRANRAQLSEHERNLDHGEWLYGEDGLPR